MSIFSLPALEDLFLLPLSIFSCVFPFFSFLSEDFLGVLSSSILSRWPNQFILYPFNHFPIFSPLLISSSSRIVRLFYSPFSYLGPYILPNIFLSNIRRACPSFSFNVHASSPYDTTGLIIVLYNIILVALGTKSTTEETYSAKIVHTIYALQILNYNPELRNEVRVKRYSNNIQSSFIAWRKTGVSLKHKFWKHSTKWKRRRNTNAKRASYKIRKFSQLGSFVRKNMFFRYVLLFSNFQGQFALTGGGQWRPSVHLMSTLPGSLSRRLRSGAPNRSELPPVVQTST